jgi:hypothetical protein
MNDMVIPDVNESALVEALRSVPLVPRGFSLDMVAYSLKQPDIPDDTDPDEVMSVWLNHMHDCSQMSVLPFMWVYFKYSIGEGRYISFPDSDRYGFCFPDSVNGTIMHEADLRLTKPLMPYGISVAENESMPDRFTEPSPEAFEALRGDTLEHWKRDGYKIHSGRMFYGGRVEAIELGKDLVLKNNDDELCNIHDMKLIGWFKNLGWVNPAL